MTLAERFRRKVASQNADGCHLWLGAKHPDGYGLIHFGSRIRKRLLLAHRVAWELSNGQVPSDMCVLHKCDNPPCVNPEHLFLGTRRDNNIDRDMKGRTRHATGDRCGSRMHPERVARGSKVNTSKLTAEQVLEIRRRYPAETKSQLGRVFGVHHNSIAKIIKRENWAWL